MKNKTSRKTKGHTKYNKTMKNQRQNGGKHKKGNGHKSTCRCPICKNMRKSRM
jgi:hypothetical protein